MGVTKEWGLQKARQAFAGSSLIFTLFLNRAARQAQCSLVAVNAV
jgi:hypothetical protein